mgnify:CR=1 FL=1
MVVRPDRFACCLPFGCLVATVGHVTRGEPARWPGTLTPVGARVLVIDNYDSFVYNLVQYLGELGAEPVVHRHDAIDLDAMVALAPDAVLVSPGPGRPEVAIWNASWITAPSRAGSFTR